MEIIILLISLTLLILIVTAHKRKRKLRIAAVIALMVVTLIALLFYSQSGSEGSEIIASFITGSSEQLDKIKPSAEDEPGEWKLYNHEKTDSRVGNNSFTIRPTVECIWGKQASGPMIYRDAEGNIYFSSLIRTRKFSDTLHFPRDRAWQFGGIMLRDPSSEENNIYIAVGSKDSELIIEVKSTINNISQSEGYKWPSGDAELMIQREAMVFGLYARPYGTKGPWTRIHTYYRPDFPEKLQAGLIAYSYSYGRNLNDFITYFDEVNIWRDHE
jgi:hypothetical protein